MQPNELRELVKKSGAELSEEGKSLLMFITGAIEELDASRPDMLHLKKELSKKVDLALFSEVMASMRQDELLMCPSKDWQHLVASPSTAKQFVQVGVCAEVLTEVIIRSGTKPSSDETMTVDLLVNNESLLASPISVGSSDFAEDGATNTYQIKNGRVKKGDLVELDMVHTPGGSPALANVALAMKFKVL